MLNKLCLLEWELPRRYRSRSAILFGKKMQRLNQIKSAKLIHSSRLKLVFDSAHVKCDV